MKAPSTNDELFFYWMEKAARAEVPAAMYHLALAYWTGVGTKYSFESFLLWIRRASKAGYSKAFIASEVAELQSQVSADHNPLIEELYKDLDKLFDEVLKIKKDHIVKISGKKREVAHFTTFEALTSMLPEKPSPDRQANRLRLYNFAYMNDPMEGRRLLDDNIPNSEYLAEFFPTDDDKDNPIAWEAHESSVYIGSFTLGGDTLDLWRAYGRNGKGYCIVTPIEGFKQESKDDIGPLHGGEIVEVSQGTNEPAEYLDETTLYAIRYKDAQVRETRDRLNDILKRIAAKKRSLKKKSFDEKVINRIVRLILSHILYLYKNKQYISEREARMIVDLDIRAELLKVAGNDPRIFVESVDFLFKQKGSRIIIGPTVQDKRVVEINLKYRLAQNNLSDTTEVVRSDLEQLYR